MILHFEAAGMKRTPLRTKPRPRLPPVPGEEEWKRRRIGPCAVCGAVGRLEGHHVVERQRLRHDAPARLYDPLGRLDLCTACHEAHTNASRRVPLAKLPPRCLAFATEVLGDVAGDYLKRYYSS